MSRWPHQWADERKEELKALWLSGKTASQVAAAMGGSVTRNSVIGQVRRMGLHRYTERPPAPRGKLKEARRPLKPYSNYSERKQFRQLKRRQFFEMFGLEPPRRPEWVSNPPIPNPNYAQVPEPTPRHLTVLDLGAHDCRWPYGDGPFTFCGHPALEDRSYCEFHCGLAYQGRR